MQLIVRWDGAAAEVGVCTRWVQDCNGPRPPKRSPAEGELPFEYDFEHPAEEVLTAYGGIPLFVRAVRSLNVPGSVKQYLHLKQRQRGLDEASYVESFLVLNALGGECLEDFRLVRYSRSMETEFGRIVVFRSADHSAEEDAREVFTLLTEAGIAAVLCDDSAPGVPSGAFEVRVPAAEAGRAESLMRAEEAQPAEPGDPSHALDLVTVFVSDAHNAEMEALAVRGVLEVNGIPSVVVGATPYPNLPVEVRVPKALLAEAERILDESRSSGPIIETPEESDPPTGL